ncbi:hypothetical protein NliqN6_2197 [Naganishia liquefaciens]|uniref:DNA-directed RNA polymerase III subunit RPC3 n=1 Tax=Naganishia liquefaciens TaxID=104408 RepID=A0A8H3YDT2_9TREE|nr:hypothetical protein NliqN6_2197 [Naganishia liquefaciens]
MADKEAVRLAERIVRGAFGDLVGNVAHVLLNKGRLNLAEICHYTKLKTRSAQGVIIALIQHNLLWHSEVPQGEKLVEYFEFNLKECLLRLRWGRILALTEDEYGSDAMQIVRLILNRGKMRLPEIISAMGVEEMAEKGPREARRLQLSRLVYDLLTTSHILPITAKLHQAPFDEMLQRRRAAEKDMGMATQRAIATVRLQVMENIREERRKEQDPASAILRAQKKKSNGVTATSDKKIKGGEYADQVDPAAYLRINYEVYDLKLRNKLVESAVASRWNRPAGYVMKAILKASAEHKSYMRQTVSGPVSVHGLLTLMEEFERDSLALGFGAKVPAKKERLGELLAAYAALLSGDDDGSIVKNDSAFLEKDASVGRSSGNMYRVMFEQSCGKMKQQLLEQVVEQNWGPRAKRIVKVMLHGGKMGEQSISTTAMINLQDCRALLGQMHESSLIEIQQIPRSADRAANRTIFLYYVDLSHAYASILSILYKTLGNLEQRRQAELDKHKDLLERANRTDVLANRDLLSHRDSLDLATLEETMDKITTAELRTELNVFILRDLPGGPEAVRFDDPFSL